MDAAFCTPDDIALVFKQFSFVRVDPDAAGNGQIDAAPVEIEIESSSFEFGYIPKVFGECGRIDAAFMHSVDQVSIVCGVIYYLVGKRIPTLRIHGQQDGNDVALEAMGFWTDVAAGAGRFQINVVALGASAGICLRGQGRALGVKLKLRICNR